MSAPTIGILPNLTGLSFSNKQKASEAVEASIPKTL
jgi:hypothetical protein